MGLVSHKSSGLMLDALLNAIKIGVEKQVIGDIENKTAIKMKLDKPLTGRDLIQIVAEAQKVMEPLFNDLKTL